MDMEFNLSETTIEDIIKKIRKAKLSGSLCIEDKKEKGEIRFIHGAIVYARLNALEGERAVISFVVWPEGKVNFISFSTMNMPDETKENITYETEFLIKSCGKEREDLSKERELVTSLESVFEVIDSGTPTYIKTAELTVLPWIDGENTVREIGQEMERDYPGVIKSVYKLYKNNIICKRK